MLGSLTVRRTEICDLHKRALKLIVILSFYVTVLARTEYFDVYLTLAPQLSHLSCICLSCIQICSSLAPVTNTLSFFG
jgi:hypothetical protein